MLIVGLGNPGTEYAQTRHNLGFMLIDKLAREANAEVKRKECQALVGRATLEGKIVELVKPQTFMNLSGEAVGCLLRKRVDLKAAHDLLVISDDLALPLGTIRLRARGTHGGQNGLKSIIGVLGTNEFPRLRIGIQPEHPITSASNFVLDKFSKSELPTVEATLTRSVEALRAVIRDGIERAMSQHN
ncbi:MAG: aminoacyl-tRNA hydrolase [Pyrinomonadaceae bacterium MAG19_C2-C3]|nr:aminoacyl-tRNA hydrolase [Pyrinomonadaceae bacterium MAG19_C2-C3]